MSKSPLKRSLECPHCGFTQMEYAAARSTLCRQCGRHYVPSAEKRETRPAILQEAAAGESSIFRRVEGLLNRQKSFVATCFECKAKQEVSAAAKSSICPACSAHIDLGDYKITTSFSRNIRTHGEVHLTAKGDLSSNSVVCRSALIEGKLRGSLHCEGEARINYVGKIPGRLTARKVIVDRKADVQFFRQLKVGTIEIRGRMSGEILAETMVEIHRAALLDGDVIAKAITVEKGGMFSGQLVIGQQPLHQGELLPDVNPPATFPKGEGAMPPLLPGTLPAIS